MRVLLTGASGFVGLNVLRFLKTRGIKVDVILRSPSREVLSLLDSSDRVFYEEDIFSIDKSKWVEYLKHCSHVFHLAWALDSPNYLYARTNLSCLRGSLALLEAIADHESIRFLGVGTCFEYDLKCELVSNECPLRPETLYAECKAALYRLGTSAAANHHFQFIWCRLFYLYGHNDRPGRLYQTILEGARRNTPILLGSGRHVRDYLEVSEAAKRLVEFGLSDKTGPINVCSGVAVSVKEFSKQVAKELDAEHLLVFGSRPDNLFDPPYVVGIPDIL